MRRRRVFAASFAAAFAFLVWSFASDGPPSDPIALVSPNAAVATPLDSLIASGEMLYWDGEFEEARELWQHALERSAAVGDSAAHARALTWLGLAAFRLGEYEEARTLGEKALALKLRLGLAADLPKSYNALGLLALSQGKLSEAVELFRQTAEAARAVDDHETLAKAANNLGLVYSDMGEFERAQAGFIESVRAARELGDALIEGRALSNLGMLEVLLGRPLEAVALFRQARERYRASGDVTGEQHTLGQLGLAYAALGYPPRAIAALDSALALARAHGLRQEEASDLELIGDFHRDAGDHRRALDFYQQAAAINAELELAIEAGVDLRRQAEAHSALGDVDHGRALAARAVETHRVAEAHLETFRDLLVLAELEGSPSGRSAHLAEAGALARHLDSRAARVDLVLAQARIADRARDSKLVLSTLDRARADLATASYRTIGEMEALRARAHGSLGRLDLAVAAGRRALAAVERTRSSYGSGFMRTTFVHDRRAIYADLVMTLLRLGEVEEAFEVADAARGRALLEHLTAVQREGSEEAASLGTGDALLLQIDGLITRLEDLESTPLEERAVDHDSAVERLERRLSATRAQYEALVVRVNEADPAAAAILAGGNVRPRNVRAALDPDEALIEYFVAPDRLTIFVVTRETTRVFDSPVPASTLARQVRLAQELSGSRQRNRPDPSAALEALHQKLLAPVTEAGALAGVRRLVLVPHDMLAYVPFAALRSSSTGRYAVEDFVLVTIPSAAALPVLRERSRNRFDAARASVVVPFPETLPGTRAEGSAVDRALEDAVLLEGSRATEAAARRALISGGIVHIASHGALNTLNPLFSRIELARERSSRSDDDGRLEVHELLGLRIRSPLVFLSGCETAAEDAWTNAFARGEDYAALAKTFLYAGARNVVATLWRIDDRSAAIFAARFYRHLGDHPPAEALALAQQDMMRSRDYRSPYYWAGYRLSGSGRLAVAPSEYANTRDRLPQKRFGIAFHGVIEPAHLRSQ